MKSIGIDPDSYGSLLTPLLTEKLPSEVRMIIARKFAHEIWKYFHVFFGVFSGILNT